MHVLCITDQGAQSEHSSVKGIFATYLRRHCTVTLVYFSQDAKKAYRDEDGNVIVPYTRKGQLFAILEKLIELKTIDCVVVRNFITLLWGALKHRERYGYAVGFWNSFPHSFRRYFQARFENRAVLRKLIEYRLRGVLEKKLVERCDFLISMSPEFKATFYPGIRTPFLPLPMGVDLSQMPAVSAPDLQGPPRLVYTGTVDKLRQTDLIVQALHGIDADFVLDIYTQSRNETIDFIKSCGDSRIRLCAPLPRNKLFEKIVQYDLGIGNIPENDLYKVSSPTKTLEYYALGIPATVSFLPEYTRLFNDQTAFFSRFELEDMRKGLVRAMQTPRTELRKMGATGREVILQMRNYENMAGDVFRFLSDTCQQKRRHA